MDFTVVGTAHLVGSLLTKRLVVVGLSTAMELLVLAEYYVTRVTYRANLSPVSVTVSFIFCWVDLVESGVMCSLALVEKSLRPASDMLRFV